MIGQFKSSDLIMDRGIELVHLFVHSGIWSHFVSGLLLLLMRSVPNPLDQGYKSYHGRQNQL